MQAEPEFYVVSKHKLAILFLATWAWVIAGGLLWVLPIAGALVLGAV